MQNNALKLNKRQLHKIISESINHVLSESRHDFIEVEEFAINSRQVFGDEFDHLYNFKCFNGYAKGALADGSDAPNAITVVYPKIQEVFEDEDMIDEICDDNGITSDEINYGYIMQTYWRIEA